jgi:hypothetical protein
MPQIKFFNLFPRYTAGSPAAVKDAELAQRVCREEMSAFQAYTEGVYGAEEAEWARKTGLGCIVLEELTGALHYRDMITGNVYKDIPYTVLRNAPDKLIEVQVGAKFRYYYQRHHLHTGNGTDKDMEPVLVSLRTNFGIDSPSAEAFVLWRDRYRA